MVRKREVGVIRILPWCPHVIQCPNSASNFGEIPVKEIRSK